MAASKTQKLVDYQYVLESSEQTKCRFYSSPRRFLSYFSDFQSQLSPGMSQTVQKSGLAHLVSSHLADDLASLGLFRKEDQVHSHQKSHQGFYQFRNPLRNHCQPYTTGSQPPSCLNSWHSFSAIAALTSCPASNLPPAPTLGQEHSLLWAFGRSLFPDTYTANLIHHLQTSTQLSPQ